MTTNFHFTDGAIKALEEGKPTFEVCLGSRRNVEGRFTVHADLHIWTHLLSMLAYGDVEMHCPECRAYGETLATQLRAHGFDIIEEERPDGGWMIRVVDQQGLSP